MSIKLRYEMLLKRLNTQRTYYTLNEDVIIVERCSRFTVDINRRFCIIAKEETFHKKPNDT